MNESDISLWQTPEWEQFQKYIGTKTSRVKHVLLLKYPLICGYHYGYIQRSPVLTPDFFQMLVNTAKKKRLVFVRIDSEHPLEIPAHVKKRGAHSVQPETTLMLDLIQSEEKILQQMKRKGRYNISLAERKGVVIKRAASPDEQQVFCAMFYQLLRQTTQRDEFSGHGEGYYQTMLKELPMSEIFVAFYQEKPIAAAICTFQKLRAIYYYGASSNEHRDVMAPYLLQWEAIKEAKRRGCIEYDFLGIAPENSAVDHPWRGITEFKAKFGGAITSYPQAVDIILRPFLYQVYRFVKKIQKLIK